MDSIRFTVQVARAVRALLEDPAGEHYGFEIAKATGLKSGTLYPIMARLEEAGWVTSGWELPTDVSSGRPRRRYYRLSPDAAARARVELAGLSGDAN
jgi:PadR family transcriptional regulator PadR